MKPGPRPSSNAPKSTHVAFTEPERKILTSMGSGDVKAKIRKLIEWEGDRQKPKSKNESYARWILLRREAREINKTIRAVRSQMLVSGFTEEEIRTFEDEDEANYE